MSKGGSKTRLPMGLDALSLIQAQTARLSAPGRHELFKQVGQALRTGMAPPSRIPIIQQAVSASRSAASRATSTTAEELARRNIGGTFGAQTMAQTRQAGDRSTSAIAPQYAAQIASQAPSLFNMIPGGSLASGNAGAARSDTLSPAIGAGGEIAGALIKALTAK